MNVAFADVLDSEAWMLTAVTDSASLAAWRDHLVEQMSSPRSPYVRAVTADVNAHGRDAFLDRWHTLLGSALHRLAGPDSVGSSIDAAATLVLASLHGGILLGRVTREQRSVSSAVNFALAPFLSSANR